MLEKLLTRSASPVSMRPAKRSVPRRDEELSEAERIEVERVDLAHGIPAPLVNGNAQKRPGSSHHAPRGVLTKVLEARQRFGARLDLVEDDERVALGHDLARIELDGRDDARDVVAQLELLAHPGIVVEVHVCDVPELRPAELFFAQFGENEAVIRALLENRLNTFLLCRMVFSRQQPACHEKADTPNKAKLSNHHRSCRPCCRLDRLSTCRVGQKQACPPSPYRQGSALPSSHPHSLPAR